jgi:hypothetical protein
VGPRALLPGLSVWFSREWACQELEVVRSMEMETARQQIRWSQIIKRS